MMFTEVFVPKGVLTHDRRVQLARLLTTTALHERPQPKDEPAFPDADPGVLDFLESITHVLVHEVDVWVAGGEPLGSDQPPRYVVRVHVPGPWRKPMSTYLITRITGVLAEFDAERPHGPAEVHVLGIPEGGYGAFGRVVGDAVMMDLISEAVRGGEKEIPAGMAIDPVCGMISPLAGPDVITAEVAGTTYAFCSPGCRSTFLRRQREETGVA